MNVMKRMMNRIRKGFTTAEVLIAVAILAVLFAVGAPMLISLQKNLRLKELDDCARQIYLAAQNQLTAVDAAGTLDATAKAANGDTDPDGATWFNKENLGDLIQDGSIEGTVASNSYAVKIDFDTATVIEVLYFDPLYNKNMTAVNKDNAAYYSDDGGSQERRKSDYVGQYDSDDIYTTDSEGNKTPVKRSKLRYLPVSLDIKDNEVEVKNGNDTETFPDGKLRLEITASKYTDGNGAKVTSGTDGKFNEAFEGNNAISIKLKVRVQELDANGEVVDKSGAGTKTVDIQNLSNISLSTDTEKTVSVTLDDLTGKSFNELMKEISSTSDITPGADIRLTVWAEVDGSQADREYGFLSTKSSIETNSLFESINCNGETTYDDNGKTKSIEDVTKYQIFVSNPRHLQNLDYGTSAVNLNGITENATANTVQTISEADDNAKWTVFQIADIDWNEQKQYHNPDGTAAAAATADNVQSFKPISLSTDSTATVGDSSYMASYIVSKVEKTDTTTANDDDDDDDDDDNDTKVYAVIKNLTITANKSDSSNNDSYSGLFAKTIGSLNNTIHIKHLSLVGLKQDSTATEYGGIVGKASRTVLEDCSLINPEQKTSNASDTTGANVGGMVGEAAGNVTIKNCKATVDANADGYNANIAYHQVFKGAQAGGLIGFTNATDGKVSVTNCVITDLKQNFPVNKRCAVGGMIGFAYSANSTNSTNRTVVDSCKLVNTIITVDEKDIADTGANIGGLVGTVTNSDITNCQVYVEYEPEEGDSTATVDAQAALSKKKCEFYAQYPLTVTFETKYTRVGGLVGRLENGAISKSSASWPAITVTGDEVSYVGGLVGFVVSGSTIEYSYADTGLVQVKVDETDKTKTVSSWYAGENKNFISGIVTDYKTAGVGNKATAGGLFGTVGEATVNYCYSMGYIAQAKTAGGLAGNITSSLTVDKCYAFVDMKKEVKDTDTIDPNAAETDTAEGVATRYGFAPSTGLNGTYKYWKRGGYIDQNASQNGVTRDFFTCYTLEEGKEVAAAKLDPAKTFFGVTDTSSHPYEGTNFLQRSLTGEPAATEGSTGTDSATAYGTTEASGKEFLFMQICSGSSYIHHYGDWPFDSSIELTLPAPQVNIVDDLDGNALYADITVELPNMAYNITNGTTVSNNMIVGEESASDWQDFYNDYYPSGKSGTGASLNILVTVEEIDENGNAVNLLKDNKVQYATDKDGKQVTDANGNKIPVTKTYFYQTQLVENAKHKNTLEHEHYTKTDGTTEDIVLLYYSGNYYDTSSDELNATSFLYDYNYENGTANSNNRTVLRLYLDQLSSDESDRFYNCAGDITPGANIRVTAKLILSEDNDGYTLNPMITETTTGTGTNAKTVETNESYCSDYYNSLFWYKQLSDTEDLVDNDKINGTKRSDPKRDKTWVADKLKIRKERLFGYNNRVLADARIYSCRHLQNLDTASSNVNNATIKNYNGADVYVTNAYQYRSLDWQNVLDKSGTYFNPIVNTQLVKYDGSYNTISNLKINSNVSAKDENGNTILCAGLFGNMIGTKTTTTDGNTTYSRSIWKVKLVNPTIYTRNDGQYAGGLVGYATGIQISECQVYMDIPLNTSTEAADITKRAAMLKEMEGGRYILNAHAQYSGGLVGSIADGHIASCSASWPSIETEIETGTSGTETVPYSGGLAGKATGTNIYYCYADTGILEELKTTGTNGDTTTVWQWKESADQTGFNSGVNAANDSGNGYAAGLVADLTNSQVLCCYSMGYICHAGVGAGMFGTGSSNLIKWCYSFTDLSQEIGKAYGFCENMSLLKAGNYNNLFYWKQCGSSSGCQNDTESKIKPVTKDELKEIKTIINPNDSFAVNWTVDTETTNPKTVTPYSDTGDSFKFVHLKSANHYGDWVPAGQISATIEYNYAQDDKDDLGPAVLTKPTSGSDYTVTGIENIVVDKTKSGEDVKLPYKEGDTIEIRIDGDSNIYTIVPYSSKVLVTIPGEGTAEDETLVLDYKDRTEHNGKKYYFDFPYDETTQTHSLTIGKELLPEDRGGNIDIIANEGSWELDYELCLEQGSNLSEVSWPYNPITEHGLRGIEEETENEAGTGYVRKNISYNREPELTLYNPTREGRRFLGWYYDAGYTQKVEQDKNGRYVLDFEYDAPASGTEYTKDNAVMQNKKVYAKWSAAGDPNNSNTHKVEVYDNATASDPFYYVSWPYHKDSWTSTDEGLDYIYELVRDGTNSIKINEITVITAAGIQTGDRVDDTSEFSKDSTSPFQYVTDNDTDEGKVQSIYIPSVTSDTVILLKVHVLFYDDCVTNQKGTVDMTNQWWDEEHTKLKIRTLEATDDTGTVTDKGWFQLSDSDTFKNISDLSYTCDEPRDYDHIPGWAEDPDDKTTKYKEGDTYTIKQPAGATEEVYSDSIYALWKAAEYGIHYELDGGSYTVPAGTTVAAGETYDPNPSIYTAECWKDPIVLEAPHKDGYTFKGWYINYTTGNGRPSNFDDTTGKICELLPVVTEEGDNKGKGLIDQFYGELYLYARFDPVITYKVRLNGEDVTSTSPVKPGTIALKDTTDPGKYEVSEELMPVKQEEGKTPVAGSTPKGATITLATENFNSYGYHIVWKDESGKEVTSGVSKDGKTFTPAVNEYGLYEGHTYYADVVSNTYVIRYYANKPADRDTVTPAGPLLQNYAFEDTNSPTLKTKDTYAVENYRLVGWTKEQITSIAAGQTPDYEAGAKIVGSELIPATPGDNIKTEGGVTYVNLYALWERTSYTISFDNNGHGGSNHRTLNINVNKTVKESVTTADLATFETLTDSTNAYYFDGWYLTEDSSGTPTGDRYYFDVKMTEDITVHAKWLKNYTINFYKDSTDTTPCDTQTRHETEKVVRPTNLNLTKDDGIFNNKWYKQDETEWNFGTDTLSSTTVGSGSVLNLYAGWSPICTVTFNLNGKQTASGETQFTTTVESGKKVPASSASYPWDSTGKYQIVGWYENSECTGTAWMTSGNESSTIVTGAKTVYAKWEQKKCSITIVSSKDTYTIYNGSNSLWDIGSKPQIPESTILNDTYVTQSAYNTDWSYRLSEYRYWIEKSGCIIKVNNSIVFQNDAGVRSDNTWSASWAYINHRDKGIVSGDNWKYHLTGLSCSSLNGDTVIELSLSRGSTVTAYNIVFNMAEYEGLTAKPETQIVANGGYVTNPGEYTYGDYKVTGWYHHYVERGGYNDQWSFSEYVASSDLDSGSSDTMTLYAKWEKTTSSDKYTVKFNMGPYQGLAANPPDQQVDKGGKVSPPGTCTYGNYVVTGWYKNYDSSKSKDNEKYSGNEWNFSQNTVGSRDVDKDGVMTLYAKWKDKGNNYYTVKFNMTEYEDYAPDTPADQIILNNNNKYGCVKDPATVNNHGPYYAYVDNNVYKVTAWNYNYTDRGQTKTGTWTFSNKKIEQWDHVNNVVTLYADWTKVTETCTVTFNLQGHGSNSTQTVTKYGYASKPTDPTSDGYQFLGWYTAAEGGTQFAFTTTRIESDITLYAHWRETPYTITYEVSEPADYNYASYYNTVYTVQKNESYTIGGTDTSVTDPVWKDSNNNTMATFMGWYTNSDFSGTAYKKGSTITNITSNITLYPRWQVTYTLMNNTSNSDNDYHTVTADYGKKTTEYDTDWENLSAHPVWTHNGWFTERSGGTNVGSIPNIIFTQNRTLYAQWDKRTVYNIVYDGNGATGGSTTHSVTDIPLTTTEITLAANGFTKHGCGFTGWAEVAEPDSSKTIYKAGDKYTIADPEPGNYTFYAQWGTQYEYTITFEAGDGADPVTAKKYKVTDTVTLPSTTKDGGIFQYWKVTKADADTNNENSWELNSTYKAGSYGPGLYGNVTLTAVWKELPKITVTTYGDEVSGTTPTSGQNSKLTRANRLTADIEIPTFSDATVKSGYNISVRVYDADDATKYFDVTDCYKSDGTSPKIASLDYDTVNGTKFTILLDSLDPAETQFSELAGGSIAPGKNIKIVCTLQLKQGDEVKYYRTGMTLTNSLYAYSRTTDYKNEVATAKIANPRHLQNLNNGSSGVNNGTETVTTAALLADIDWNNAKVDSKQISYRAIWTDRLKTVKGNYHTISNISCEAAGNVGLISNLSSGTNSPFVVSDLRLDNCHFKSTGSSSAKDGTIQNSAGSIIGGIWNSKKTVTLSGVLVTSDAADAIESVEGNAGGLIGDIGDAIQTVTIKDSAASVYVTAGVHAGGMVGSNAGTLTITGTESNGTRTGGCYVGGHTGGDGKYNNVYNIVSVDKEGKENGSAAGGIVGLTTGSLNIYNTFATASVYAPANTTDNTYYAGGAIGRVASCTAVMDMVYVLAPTDGTVITDVVGVNAYEKTTHAGFIGAVTGDTGYVSNTNTFYLAEVYNKANAEDRIEYHTINVGGVQTDVTTAQYLGGYDPLSTVNPTKIKNRVGLAYYENGSIATELRVTHNMTIKVYPYDATLKNYDYPYKNWTKFKFDTDTEYASMYGDWQPILYKSQDPKTVTFKYHHPGTDLATDPNVDLGTQTIIKGRENTLVLPSTPVFPNYTDKDSKNKDISWFVCTYDETSKKYVKLSETPLTVNDDGTVVIPEAYCGDDVTVIKFYQREKNTDHTIFFMYNEENPTSSYEEDPYGFEDIKDVTVSENTRYDQVTPPVKNVVGYTLEGWYDQNGNKIDFTSTETISDDIVAYARYTENITYTVTIEFMYQVGEGEYDVTNVSRLPQSYLAEGEENVNVNSRYKIERLVGNAGTVGETVTVNIPRFTTSLNLEDIYIYDVSAGKYEDGKTDQDPNKLTINAKARQYVKDNHTMYTGEDKTITNTADLVMGEEKNYTFVVVYVVRPETNFVVRYNLNNTDTEGNVIMSAASESASSTSPGSTQFYYTSTDKKNCYSSKPDHAIVLKTVESSTSSKVPAFNFTTPEGFNCESNLNNLTFASDTVQAYVGDELKTCKVVDLVFSRNKYVLEYDLQGGTVTEKDFKAAVYYYYGETLKAPECTVKRTGRIFTNWSLSYVETTTTTGTDGKETTNAETKTLAWGDKMPAYKVTAKANYEGDEVGYTVVYMVQNAVTGEHDQYSYFDSYTAKATAGTTIYAKDCTGEMEDTTHYHYETSNPNNTSIVVSEDGTSVLKVYFSRQEYTVKFYEYNSNNRYVENTARRITGVYLEDVSAQWPTNSEGKSTSWKISSNSSTYQCNIGVLDKNYSFYSTDQYKAVGYYYLEKLDGVTYTQQSYTRNGVNYYLDHTDSGFGTNFYITDDDKYPIEGFTYERYVTSSGSGSTYNNTKFLYSRNDYELKFQKDSGHVYTITVPYQTDLTKYSKTNFKTIGDQNITEYFGMDSNWYELVDWYEDEDCTVRVDLTGMTMPAGNMLLYGKWKPKPVTVTVHRGEGAFPNTSAESITLEDTRYDDILADKLAKIDDNGVSIYKPVREGYTFNGWIDKDGDPFNVNQEIKGNYDLYPTWVNDVQISGKTLKVWFGYYKTDTQTETKTWINLIEEPEVYHNYSGFTISLEAVEIDGYVPNVLATHYTFDNQDEQNYYFEYEPERGWYYTTDYYVDYKSSLPKDTAESERIQALITEKTGKTISSTGIYKFASGRQEASNEYMIISPVIPENLSGYTMTRYEIWKVSRDATSGVLTEVKNLTPDDNTGTSIQIQSPDEKDYEILVKYYLAPDYANLSVPDQYELYDGTDKDDTMNPVGDEYKPTGAEVSGITHKVLMDTGYDSKGTKIPAINAGDYPINGYYLIEVSGTKDGAAFDDTFLIDYSENENLKLKIGKRSYHFRSENLSIVSKDDKLAELSKVYVTGDLVNASTAMPVSYSNFNESSEIKSALFPNGEGFEITSSVESFRKSVGTMTNIFKVSPLANTDVDKNYTITTEYGTLTVGYWQYEVEVYYVDDDGTVSNTPLAAYKFADNTELTSMSEAGTTVSYAAIAEKAGLEDEYELSYYETWQKFYTLTYNADNTIASVTESPEAVKSGTVYDTDSVTLTPNSGYFNAVKFYVKDKVEEAPVLMFTMMAAPTEDELTGDDAVSMAPPMLMFASMSFGDEATQLLENVEETPDEEEAQDEEEAEELKDGDAAEGEGTTGTGDAAEGEGTTGTGDAAEGEGTTGTGDASEGEGTTGTEDAAEGEGTTGTGDAAEGEGTTGTEDATEGEGTTGTGDASEGEDTTKAETTDESEIKDEPKATGEPEIIDEPEPTEEPEMTEEEKKALEDTKKLEEIEAQLAAIVQKKCTEEDYQNLVQLYPGDSAEMISYYLNYQTGLTNAFNAKVHAEGETEPLIVPVNGVIYLKLEGLDEQFSVEWKDLPFAISPRACGSTRYLRVEPLFTSGSGELVLYTLVTVGDLVENAPELLVTSSVTVADLETIEAMIAEAVTVQTEVNETEETAETMQEIPEESSSGAPAEQTETVS